MVDYKHINTTPTRRRATHFKVAVFLVGFVGLMGLVGHYEQEIEPVEVAAAMPVKSETQRKIEKLLPEQIAKPIAERTAYPLTMAAIAHTESRGKVGAVGDGGESIGMFQIQPKHWGNVDAADPLQQIEKANSVFTFLVAKHGYRKAVALWNGNPDNPKVKAYQKIVLAKVRDLERGR